MTGEISIKNQSGPVAVIDIEGVIGVPEEEQFADRGQRVSTYENFCASIQGISAIESPSVIVNIRSTGGNVNDALLIYEALTELNASITTRCYGYVASAATIIAQAASEGRREISANSLYLVHRAVCTAEGNANEITRTVGMLETTDERLACLYAGRAGAERQVFMDLMNENNGSGRWLSPKEVLQYGLADKITGPSEISSQAEQAVLNMGLPPIPQIRASYAERISRKWKAVVENLGISAANDEVSATVVSDEPQTGASEDTPEDAVKLPPGGSFTAAQEVSEQAAENKLAEEVRLLQNKIETLEAENARLAAGATTTKPKEDPSVHEARRSPNEEAYLSDIRRFR